MRIECAIVRRGVPWPATLVSGPAGSPRHASVGAPGTGASLRYIVLPAASAPGSDRGPCSMASPDGSSPQSGGRRDDEAYEEEHVHQVYQQIAEHFSSTRYKAWKRFAFFFVWLSCSACSSPGTRISADHRNLQPWPLVERFLKDLAPGAIGLDIGCGNGKYLAVNPNVFIIASDRQVFGRNPALCDETYQLSVASSPIWSIKRKRPRQCILNL